MAITRVRFTEGNSGQIISTITDTEGVFVPSDALTEAELTLYDQQTESIINTRDAQDILGVGSPVGDHGVTIYPTLQTDSEGNTYNVKWVLVPADNVIVTERRQMERHRAMFRFVWPDGELVTEFEIEVQNLRLEL